MQGLAITAKRRGDEQKIGDALNKLVTEDPTFKVSTDQDTGQTIISGMGELHLEIIVDRLKRELITGEWYTGESNTGEADTGAAYTGSPVTRARLHRARRPAAVFKGAVDRLPPRA